VLAPADYQQGESFRIIYIHVPSAWMSMLVYFIMVAEVVAKVSAPIGATFTLIALVTGAVWGKPMWGTWWVWDARLTSELILLFLYLAYISLNNAFDNPKTAAKASSILAIVGLVNLPIIHYSVKWWNTLHQGSMFNDMSNPSMHPDMLWPLLIMVFAFQFLYGVLALVNARDEVLVREQNSRWVRAVVTGEKS